MVGVKHNMPPADECTVFLHGVTETCREFTLPVRCVVEQRDVLYVTADEFCRVVQISAPDLTYFWKHNEWRDESWLYIRDVCCYALARNCYPELIPPSVGDVFEMNKPAV